jgi:hypothetical protein
MFLGVIARGAAARLGSATLVAAAAYALAACAPAYGATGAIAERVDAQAYNSAAFAVVDHGDLPAFAGIGVQGVLDDGVNRSAITVMVTPLALARAAGAGLGRSVLEDPGAAWMRRVAARFTVGGPLQYVDPHRAARADRLTNHTTTELELKLVDEGGPNGGASPVSLTAALAADNLASGFGVDHYGGTLIAERSGTCALTANAGFMMQERYKALVRYDEARLGAEATLRLPEPGGPQRAADAGLGVSCLLRNQRRASVWQGSARLDAPLWRGVRLSLSGRASNRADLRGVDRMRALMGLSRVIG